MAASFERRIWSTEDNLKLFSIYETMPELWHQTHPSYKEISLKRESMEKLAKTFDTNVHEIRRRLHNIRAQFSCELRRLKLKSCKSNIPPSEIKTEWKFFHKLSFLMANYSHFYDYDFTEKTVDDNADESNNSVKYSRKFSQSDDDKNDSDDETKPSTSKQVIHKAEEIFIPEDDYSFVTKKMKMSDEDNRIFGEYVASELRNLSRKSALKLKLKIKRAILEVSEEEFNKDNGAEYLEFT